MQEALGATGGHAVALLAEERPDQRDVPGAGADDRVTHDQAAPHVTLGIRQPGRGALGTEHAGVQQRAGVPGVGR